MLELEISIKQNTKQKITISLAFQGLFLHWYLHRITTEHRRAFCYLKKSRLSLCLKVILRLSFLYISIYNPYACDIVTVFKENISMTGTAVRIVKKL